MHTRPCDSDIKQPAFLFDDLAFGAMGQRVRDGQRAVRQTDDEYGVPLESLGGMQRRQCHTLHNRRVARVGTQPQLGEQPGQVEIRPARHFVVDKIGQCT
jgi:hypothetical protein